jgi:DNA-binding NarL/FixJ family response regulator
MRPSPAAREILFLSAFPGECSRHLGLLRGRGTTVQVASDPGRALELLRRRPDLVLVDLIHGPGLSPSVVRELNREPRAARVVALHNGCIDTYIDQVEHLTVDGFCRLAGGARAFSAAD